MTSQHTNDRNLNNIYIYNESKAKQEQLISKLITNTLTNKDTYTPSTTTTTTTEYKLTIKKNHSIIHLLPRVESIDTSS